MDTWSMPDPCTGDRKSANGNAQASLRAQPAAILYPLVHYRQSLGLKSWQQLWPDPGDSLGGCMHDRGHWGQGAMENWEKVSSSFSTIATTIHKKLVKIDTRPVAHGYMIAFFFVHWKVKLAC